MMMIGSRGLAWSADGRRFAAATVEGNRSLILGALTKGGVHYQVVDVKAVAIAFIPKSNSVLVGCEGGQVTRVHASGTLEAIDALQMPDHVIALSFSSQGDRVAVSNCGPSGAALQIWSWDFHNHPSLLHNDNLQRDDEEALSSSAYSPNSSTLAYSCGHWTEDLSDLAPNDLYLFSDAGTRRITSAHANGICEIVFSPAGRHLVTVSLDRTLALRDAKTGEAVAALWSFAQIQVTAAFHPCAALMAAGEGFAENRSPGRLYLFRLAQADTLQLKVIQEDVIETGVCSLAFSPDGEHLLMGTEDRLSLFRVHLI